MSTTTAENPAHECMANVPPPEKEHEWLQQFVGEWSAEVEACMGPDQPPAKNTGTEIVRAVGGFWVVGEGRSDSVEMPYEYRLTIGYDARQKTYVASWIDSMTSYFWRHTGSVDASGKILTLETEGPCPMDPSKLYRFREKTEFKSKDHRLFTSEIQGDDGAWNTIMTVNLRRK